MGPLGPIAATAAKKAVFPALANIGSSLFGAFTGMRQQKKANSFNVDMWNRQNIYNSPAEQIKRLKAAGLNPNLIYGSGASGASGTAQGAPQFEKLADQGYRPVDVPSTLESLQSFTDWDIKKATADNLTAKTETEKQNAVLKATQAAQLSAGLPYAEQLAKTNLQAAMMDVKQRSANLQFTQNADSRADMKLQADIAEAVQRISASQSGIKLNQAQIGKIIQDTKVQKFYADLAEKGISPDTPWAAKILADMIKDMFPKFEMPSFDWKWPWQD